tara:strand:- start:69 stop:1052 length:984 start_codon:yes stop_codon:yes gene_type:complete
VTKSVEKDITVIIPSRSYDQNLSFCIKNIRKYYKKIKIFLILDKYQNFKKDNKIKIFVSGNETIGFKRNLAVKNCKTRFVCFIDSDAYPKSFWLNDVHKLFKKYKKLGAVGGPNLSPKTKDIEKKLVSRSRKLSFVTLNTITKSNRENKECYVNFLPSCNLIVRTDLYKKVKGMYENLYSGEEISLNKNIRKLGYKIMFCPSIYVFHKDRNFKHFARQRFVYGSTGLRTFLKFPCLESFLLLISSLPFIFILMFPLIFLSEFYLNIYILGLLFIFIVCLINAFKINYSSNFFKSLKLTFISIFMPGIGFVSSILLKDYIIKKLYTQK